jgi:hypothetical protein
LRQGQKECLTRLAGAGQYCDGLEPIMRSFAFSTAVLLLVMSGASRAQEIALEPVVVKSIVLDGRKIAPGGAVAEIFGLRKGGDGFVSVRSGSWS